MLVDRDPLDGDALASQPTLSRFESVVNRKDLLHIGESLAETVIERHRRKSGRTEHVYGECRYRAGTWTRARRVIIKAEVVVHPGREPKDNSPFVVTNLTGSSRRVYERSYCYRGEIENWASPGSVDTI
jgi:hypothetical protein